MSQISVQNLTFCYDGNYDDIFENVSFQLDTSWKLGFIGRNGKGKTTFLNLLLGKYTYSGSITATVDFEYFPYEVRNKTRLSIDIIHDIFDAAQDWKLLKELGKLDVSDDVLFRPYETLSNGERTKLLLAALFIRENSFLLIDEPTNHLDMKGREIVAKYLNTKSGFILVSHDRVFLDACIDHVLSINKCNIEIQKGNFTSWSYNKQLSDSYERSENERLEKDIRRLKDASAQSKAWADKVESDKIGYNPKKDNRSIDSRAYIGEKSRRMQQRRKNLERLQEKDISEKSKLLKNIDETFPLKLSPLTYHSSRLAELKDVSVFYGDKQVCSSISFSVNNGEKIALTGKNGSGKSSILKLINREAIGHTGIVYTAPSLKISYVAQDTSKLSGSLDDYVRYYAVDMSLFKAILTKLDISSTQFSKPLESFSEGQKKKVMIARSLCEECHLYIWDEPLNFIDIFSRLQIEELLKKYSPTLLFVEHDSAFCDNISNRKIQL